MKASRNAEYQAKFDICFFMTVKKNLAGLSSLYEGNIPVLNACMGLLVLFAVISLYALFSLLIFISGSDISALLVVGPVAVGVMLFVAVGVSLIILSHIVEE